MTLRLRRRSAGVELVLAMAVLAGAPAAAQDMELPITPDKLL